MGIKPMKTDRFKTDRFYGVLGRIAILLAVLLSLLVGAGRQRAPVLAQTYSFTVPKLEMAVTVRPDASIAIVYDITFDNAGSPIDIVDIGTPTDEYDLSQFQASIDGQPLTDIRTSEYIDVGVEIHLGQHAIPPGETGTLHVEFPMPDMVYADTTNEDLASFQITPTWFDGDLVAGTGDVEIRVITPEGAEPDEVLYQNVQFNKKFEDDQGRVVAVWLFEDVYPTQAYEVGVSFPRRTMDRIVEITFWDLLGRWLSDAAGWIFGGLAFCLPPLFILFVIFSIVRGIVRATKPQYLPPIAEVEGGGIKRGLTSPEAAVILEQPLNKILLLVIFGMLEKGLIRVTEDDPLTVEVVEDFRVTKKPHLEGHEDAQRAHRRKAAMEKGTVIHAYEQPFLDVIEADPDKPVKKLDVVEPMETLVNAAAAKMQGFDLSDTREYYQRIVERAAEQAASLGDIEQREAYLDKYLPWVMMNRDYRPATTVGRYHYWPGWARQSASSGGRTAAGSSSVRGGGGRGSSTSFGDVTASFAGWTETTMGGMAAAILPTRLSKPSLSSSSGGSSGGSSCACACAGCACACACAGGGR
jgi:hypothetical protein